MNLISENNSVFLTILIISILLILYFSYSFKKLKTTEKNRLKTVILELKAEKLISNRLKKVPEEISKIEKNIKEEFQKINVKVLNINFSLSEIFLLK